MVALKMTKFIPKLTFNGFEHIKDVLRVFNWEGFENVLKNEPGTLSYIKST
jgi:hypothetical protein